MANRERQRSVEPAEGVSSEPGLIVYRFGAGIFYANAQHLTDELMELSAGESRRRWIVLDAAAIDDIDFTGGKTVAELAEQLRRQAVKLALADTRKAVRRELGRYGLEEPFFDTVDEARAAFHAEPARTAAS